MCNNCKKENHFEPNVHRKPQKYRSKRRQVNTVTDEYSSDEESEEEVLTVDLDEVNSLGNNKNGKKVFASMVLGNQTVKMLVDSGASCNIMPMKFIPKGTLIKKTDQTLSMYSKSTMTAVGGHSKDNEPKELPKLRC
jgi:hypothetical protein